MVSSKKVADLAGVSISTVSRVFSNPSLVNEKTRKKILKIANELNYFPDINARALKLNKSHIIGVIVSDISNPFYMKILKEVMTWSDKNNTKYRFYVTFTNEDKTNEIGAIRSLISSKVDYMIFTPVSNNNKDVESMIIDNNLLTLQLYRHAYDSLDSLKIDDEFGTYLATTELIENNHKEILLLDFDVPTPTNRDIGYFAAFKEKNMDINYKLIHKFSFHCNLQKEIYKVLELKNYTAVIASSNIIGNIVLDYFRENNIKIKDDVSLIMYDDYEVAKQLNISAITHPINDIIENIINLFESRTTKAEEKPRHIKLKPYIIKRNSIKKL